MGSTQSTWGFSEINCRESDVHYFVFPNSTELNHNGCPKEAKEDRRVYQQQIGFGHEIRQVSIGLQKDPRNFAHGKSQIGDHCQQHSSSQEIRDRILRYVGQNWCPPLLKTTSNWEPPVVNISACAPFPSQILEIPILSDQCHKERHNLVNCNFFFILKRWKIKY